MRGWIGAIQVVGSDPAESIVGSPVPGAGPDPTIDRVEQRPLRPGHSQVLRDLQSDADTQHSRPRQETHHRHVAVGRLRGCVIIIFMVYVLQRK